MSVQIRRTKFSILVTYEKGCRYLDLSKVSYREGLKALREPHWQRIRNGCFLGFRPSKRGGPGTWIARAYDPDTSRYRTKSLGDLGKLSPRDRFSAAKSEAESFAELIESGGHRHEKIETIGQACRAYARDKPDAEGRFKRFIYSDPISRIKIDKLRRHHLVEWRQRLEETPALVSRSKKGERKTRERSPSSINRDMVPLRAALFRVLPAGLPATEAAWQEALLPIKNADRQRTLYLDRTQRRQLLDAIQGDAKPFVTALCLLPLRPGAMSSLSVADFDRRTGELTIGKDKSGRTRRITLPDEAASLMHDQVQSKLPTAPLFMRGLGTRWTKDSWNKPIAEASARAGLPEGITTYTIRHSVLTDLVNGGLPILTVAQISDTSVEMIERHYGHLNRTEAKRALAALSL